ncbi:MAG: PhoPQ-activated pathogenicity-related family protein [Candidatus Hydrogenedentes bacterium]|nr:PhoPQ-activated pathogenicity-related family protein [Candidatus Hydrogenedentota bacterium]
MITLKWRPCFTFTILSITLILSSMAPASTLRVTENLTPLDEYVAAPDPSYSWELRHTHHGKGWEGHVLYMASQTWLTEEQVDRSLWEHWLVIIIPDEVVSTTGFMMIGGGNNQGNMPKGADANLRRIARATKTVCAQIHQVPNQPLYFTDDGKRRTEDAIIAHNWDKFFRTGDPIWPTRMPMTKSVVRAMDTVQTFCASDAGGNVQVEDFCVAGASKRGWTTWTTAAVDNRVIACSPIVIDMLNLVPSFIHHYNVYGFWAPAVDDYVNIGIMDWLTAPEFDALLQIVDPYHYRDRLTMPKLIMNGAGDQFFLNDSWKFYWDDLQGPKYLRYAPNSGHGMDQADAAGTLIAFYNSIINDVPLPKYDWSFPDDETIRVTSDTQPIVVKVWQAANPESRDFRIDKIGPVWEATELTPDAEGAYIGKVSTPEKGWTAYLVEMTFDVPGKDDLVITSPTRVVPDTEPFNLELKTEWPGGFISDTNKEK